MDAATSPSYDLQEMPPSDRELLSTIRKDSFLIIILGLSGVGKSKLVELLGAEPLRMSNSTIVGHSLERHTKAIDVYRLAYREKSFIFIDTPGFEDDVIQNSDILQLIADFLVASYKTKKYPDAVIYAFKITETRFMDHAAKNLKLFEGLCGSDGMELVTLLTTMWDLSGDIAPNRKSDFEGREELLIQRYWSGLIRDGAETRRSWNSRDTLLPILDRVIAKQAQRRGLKQAPRALQLQRELMESKQDLSVTSAGSLLADEFRERRAWLSRMRRRLLKNLEKDPDNKDLQNGLQDIDKRIEQIVKGARKLAKWKIAGGIIGVCIALLGFLALIS